MDDTIFFCQNKKCKNANLNVKNTQWYIRKGTHKTKAFGLVQRYKCKTCGKTFSDQTFSLNYYLKIKTDFKEISSQFNSSNSDCFTSRHFDMSFDSLQNRRNRFARNCLYFQTKALEGIKITEQLCSDGFESYTASKFYPNNVNLLVGKDNKFLYYFTESHQKRKGAMTATQKKQVKTEYNDKSFTDSTLTPNFTILIQYLEERFSGKEIELYTDEHNVYSTVIKSFNAKWKEKGLRIVHIQTSSKKMRTIWNPLAAANYMDMLFRKDIPNHRRKTICKARNDRNMLSRMAVYMVSHNFFKPRKILSRRKQVSERHYHGLGIDEQKVKSLKSKLFTERFFISRVQLPAYFEDMWFQRTHSPLHDKPGYVPQFAAA